MSVQIIRLTTGEELIATVKESKSNFIVLKDIAILLPHADEIGLAPFMPYSTAEDGLVINTTSIMFQTIPVPQFLETYNQMFGKIVTPSTRIIA